MVVFDKNAYKLKKDAFIREHKRVQPYSATTSDGEPKEPRRKLTENLQLREEYKQALVETYNDIVDYLLSVYKDSKISPEDKLDTQLKVNENITKLKESFITLNLKYEFEKNIFAKIDINKIIEESIDDSADSSSSTVDDSTKQKELNEQAQNSAKTNNSINKISTADNKSDDPNNTPTMPQSKLDFLQACHAAIDYKYDGDPSGLETFVDAIDLLSEVVEEANKPTLLKFIMTRLEGKAREAIITTPKEPAEITTQLKKAIKTESSKVIQGKMLALRAERTNLTKFSERAEELAEQYRRSLIDEGYAKEKAKELSVEKTIELCIKQSRHERLKSILASKTFSEPKDVIAKMIIVINDLRLESSSNSHKNGNQNRFGKNFSNNRSSRSNGQNSNNYSQNRGGNKSGHSSNNNGNGNRSNYNSNGNNRSGQNNGQNRTFTNTSYRRGNDQSVRIASGNSMNPGNGGETNDN